MAQRRLERVAAALALCALLAAPALAQITTGNVAGTVKDAQGGVVPGATVVLDQRDARHASRRPSVTNDDRRLRVPERHAGHLHRRSHDGGLQDAARGRACRSAAATASACRRSTLEVGGAAETVNVIRRSRRSFSRRAASARSRSTTEQIENLPINRGNFTSLTSFTPGVVGGGASAGGTRLGGASQNNIMMDGVSAMDTGNNGQMLNMNIESIGEVKILTQGYQAEYGRSSGLQITAVTKSGTNQFRGSAYDIQTDSDWNANSWVNEKNGDPKPKTTTKTLGYTIGGPVGKPGGTNKLFFFYAHEYRPATAAINGGNPIRLRVPTAARARRATSRRRSTTTARSDSDSSSTRVDAARRCSGNNVPADSGEPARTGSGQAILNRYPLPNVTQAPGTNYNYEVAARRRPTT